MRSYSLHCLLLLVSLTSGAHAFSLPLVLAKAQVLYNEQGVVSLQEDPSSSSELTIVAGTKRGNLELFQWDSASGTLVHCSPHNNSAAMKCSPYPVYALRLLSPESGEPNPPQLFCGSGDRYISVWEKVMDNSNGSGNVQWRSVQKLGPHTGWVKALALDKPRNLLHSIGCNCIETWARTNGSGNWEHLRKRSIDSSPDQGCTLSSDLLCLAHSGDYVFAGGVDGRIHCFSSNPKVLLEPLKSIAAHDGRVNALTMLQRKELTLLFSCGHDGSVQCRTWTPSNDDNGKSLPRCLLSEVPIATTSLWVEDNPTSSRNRARITAMACHSSDEPESTDIRILVGTTTGCLVELLLTSEDGSGKHYKMKERSRTCLGEDVIINALLVRTKCERTDANLLIVGHSKGMSTISFDALGERKEDRANMVSA